MYEKSNYKCDKCGKRYNYSRSLWRHKKFECGVTPKFTCPHCPYIAVHNHSLKLHIFNKHLRLSLKV